MAGNEKSKKAAHAKAQHLAHLSAQTMRRAKIARVGEGGWDDETQSVKYEIVCVRLEFYDLENL